MFKRRSSRLSFLPAHKARTQSLTSPPTPKPGRTLVMSSTSSTIDLHEYTRQNSEPNINESYSIGPLHTHEPLFDDIYLHPQLFDVPSPLSQVQEDQIWTPSPPRSSNIRWAMDLDLQNSDHQNSSDEEDDILDSYCSTPPDSEFLATQVTILYSGKARLIDLFPRKDSSKRPSLQLSHIPSRRSSASTRDYSVSSFNYSNSDGRSSPASSISDYSNLIYETIPEDSAIKLGSGSDADHRPFKRGFHLQPTNTISKLSTDSFKQPTTSLWEVSPSSSTNSSVTKFEHSLAVSMIPKRLSSFSSDASLSVNEETYEKFEPRRSPWGEYLPEQAFI